MRVLDPGSGTGILSAAVCEAARLCGTVKTIHVDAYETDSGAGGSLPVGSQLLAKLACSAWK